MTDQLFPFTLKDLYNEAERELQLRMRVYPRWIERGKLTKKKADLHLGLMRAIKAQLLKDMNEEASQR
jgi:hypothetical protein